MASLARIAPDAVLHNVMPIFTFMGSNVFHRDDAYSFRVVQKARVSIHATFVLLANAFRPDDRQHRARHGVFAQRCTQFWLRSLLCLQGLPPRFHWCCKSCAKTSACQVGFEYC